MKTLEQAAKEYSSQQMIEWMIHKLFISKNDICLRHKHKHILADFKSILQYKFFLPSSFSNKGLMFKGFGAASLIMLIKDYVGVTKQKDFDKILPNVRHCSGSLYAAGPIESAPDGGIGYRENLKTNLKMVNIRIISPTDFAYNKGLKSLKEYKATHTFEETQAMSEQIVDGDINAVKESDGTVVYLDQYIGFGTTSEASVGKAIGKPVYGLLAPDFNKEQIHPWMLGCLTRIFDSYESLRDFLLQLEVPLIPKIKKPQPPKPQYISLTVSHRRGLNLDNRVYEINPDKTIGPPA